MRNGTSCEAKYDRKSINGLGGTSQGSSIRVRVRVERRVIGLG
jgi:hypothetical protein